MRAHLRCLCNDRRIDIFDKHMIFFQQLAHFFQQFYGRNTLVRGICIREMFPDVPQRRCSQQRIHDRMEQDIRIRMSQKSLFIRYFHAADDEVSSLHQTVYVISHSDSHTYNLSADAIFKKIPASLCLTGFSNQPVPKPFCPVAASAGCQYRLQYAKSLSLLSRHRTVYQFLRAVEYIDGITAVLIYLFALI